MRRAIAPLLVLFISLGLNFHTLSTAYGDSLADVVLDIDRVEQNPQTGAVAFVGTLTNNSSADVTNISAELARGSRYDGKGSIPTGFASQMVTPWLPVSSQLAPQHKEQIQISTSTNSSDQLPSLNLPSSGSYPFSLTVSFTQDNHEYSQSATFLAGIHPAMISPYDPSVATVPSVATIIPITSRSSLAPGYTGGQAAVALTDSHLIDELNQGRLAQLLDIVATVEQNPQLRSATCLAIDPDLLITVNAVANGYIIDGTTYPGLASASTWLTTLKSLVPRMCIVQTPFAFADLNAISALKSSTLTDSAAMGDDIVNNYLHVHTLQGVLYAGEQRVNAATLMELARRGITTLISHTDPTTQTPINLIKPTAVAMNDPDSSASDTKITALNTVGVVENELFAQRDDSPQLLEISPLLDPISLHYIIDDIAALIQDNSVEPVDLSHLMSNKPPENTSFSTSDPYFKVPSVMHNLHEALHMLQDFSSIIVTSPPDNTGGYFVAPLREDLLRAISTTNYTENKSLRHEQIKAANSRIIAVIKAIKALEGRMRALSPSTNYTMTSSKSPLVLALSNTLPVSVRVKLDIHAPAGLEIRDVGIVEIPAQSRIQLQIPTHSAYALYTSVVIQLESPSGRPINSPIQIYIHAHSYGKIFLILAIAVTIILVALVVRRFYRKFGGKKGPSLGDRPEPTLLDRMLTVTPTKLK